MLYEVKLDMLNDTNSLIDLQKRYDVLNIVNNSRDVLSSFNLICYFQNKNEIKLSKPLLPTNYHALNIHKTYSYYDKFESTNIFVLNYKL